MSINEMSERNIKRIEHLVGAIRASLTGMKLSADISALQFLKEASEKINHYIDLMIDCEEAHDEKFRKPVTEYLD